MKRSVNDAALRAKWLAAASIPLCAYGAIAACSPTGTSGLVVAPMTSASVAEVKPDAGPDATSFALRQLPEEPHQPPNNAGCTRDVSCEDPEAVALSWPFPLPFERCKPVAEKGGEKKFSVAETTSQRQQQGSEDTCCYVQFTGCSRRYNGSGRGDRGDYGGPVMGRPLIDALGAMKVAEAVTREGWTPESTRSTDDLERAKRWVRAGLIEHASVASFARFGLSLMALGAPSELVAGAHQAALEEINHAELSFDLAVRFGHVAVAPGPLEVMGAPTSSLRELVRETLALGCVNEAIAAAIAAESARGATTVTADEEERRVLAIIATDEASHAALAYRTIAWARSIDDALVRGEVQAALDALDALVPFTDDVVLDRETIAQVTESVLTHAVRPCLLALLA